MRKDKEKKGKEDKEKDKKRNEEMRNEEDKEKRNKKEKKQREEKLGQWPSSLILRSAVRLARRKALRPVNANSKGGVLRKVKSRHSTCPG